MNACASFGLDAGLPELFLYLCVLFCNELTLHYCEGFMFVNGVAEENKKLFCFTLKAASRGGAQRSGVYNRRGKSKGAPYPLIDAGARGTRRIEMKAKHGQQRGEKLIRVGREDADHVRQS